MRYSQVKVFCPLCQEVYKPRDIFYGYLTGKKVYKFDLPDGVFFGTSFPQTFLLNFPDLDPRIINSESLFSKNGAEAYINAIYSSTDGDLAFVPSCECGQIRGEMRRGIICPNCGTECCSHFVDKLEQKAWINIPVEMGPVLHPIWYWMLEQLTRRGAGRTTGIPLIEILLKPDSAFRGKKRQVIVPPDFEPFILDNGKARGFKAFAENVDYYMDVLLNKYSRTAKKPIANGIRKMYELYKDCMFTTKLPILHNSLNPVTDNGATLKYIDADGALFNIYSKILDYYSGIITDMGKKPGDIRKHAGGSRVNFGFRTVVHPHSEVMDTDEVVLPWGIMVNCFKPVILNFLMNKFNYTCNQALLAHRKALVTYDPIVDQCLQMYIDGTPKKKVPILFIHGDKDALVFPENANYLYNNDNGPKRLVWFVGATHCGSIIADKEKYYKVIEDFIKEEVR